MKNTIIIIASTLRSSHITSWNISRKRVMLGGGGFSYNDDVLNATPDGEESIQKLVDEIKNRAKACITSRNLPEAVKLYSKAIDVISGAVVSKENDAVKAVLHANRSMAHLNM
eukprot:gene38992-52671_t